MLVHHIATRADWAAARRSGSYTTSTRGRTLAEEGFVHAAHRDQVPDVWRRHYADADEPLVLLTIDTGRLDAEVREELVDGVRYPHVYGAIPARAVVHVQSLDRHGGTGSFTGQFMGDMVRRMLLVLAAMLLAYTGSRVGAGVDPEWGPFLGAIAGLALGGVSGVVLYRRLDRG